MTNIVPIRKRDELFEHVAETCGMNIKDLTKSSRGMLNKAVSELREINPSLSELQARARIYKEVYPSCKLTPTALVKHWPLIAPQKEDEFKQACRIAKDKGLEPYRGRHTESPEHFIERVNRG